MAFAGDPVNAAQVARPKSNLTFTGAYVRNKNDYV
jgi:hypothetical protein